MDNLTFQKLLASKGLVASEIQLFKNGSFKHWSGEEYTVDQKFKDEIIANFATMKADAKDDKFLQMNYNHGPSYSSDPEACKASGWILDIFDKEDGLYAKVEYTANAKQYIEAEEYKYISPEFAEDMVDEYGKEIDGWALFGAALTNIPFFTGMEAIKARRHPITSNKQTTKEETVELKLIAKALGLAEGASEKEILNAINGGSKEKTLLADARKALDLKDGEDVVSKITSLITAKKESETKLTTLEKKVQDLEDGALTAKAESDVQGLITADKLDPAAKAEWVELAKSNRVLFDKMAGKLTASGRFSTTGSGDEGEEEDGDDVAANFDKAVKKIMAERKISYKQASRAVQEEQPELAEAYANMN